MFFSGDKMYMTNFDELAVNNFTLIYSQPGLKYDTTFRVFMFPVFDETFPKLFDLTFEYFKFLIFSLFFFKFQNL